MSNINHICRKRISAGIIGLMVLLIAVFSAVFIIAEADHDCCGEDCPICICVHQCKDNLDRMKEQIASFAALTLLITCRYVLLTVCIAVAAVLFLNSSPVMQKIRMNN